MYYKVKTKCGHVGVKNYIEIDFPVYANTKKEASQLARKIPRVKHDRKDCIISVEEISFEEYMELEKINDNDPYLHCKNIQDQNSILNFEERVCEENIVEKKPKRKDNTWKHKKMIKEIKKSEKHKWNYYFDDELLDYAV